MATPGKFYHSGTQWIRRAPHADPDSQEVRTLCNTAKRNISERAWTRLGKEGIVVDLGCGRGGDLHKWAHTHGVKKYIGIDASTASLQEADRRSATFAYPSVTWELSNLSTRPNPLPFSNPTVYTCYFVAGGIERIDHFLNLMQNAMRKGHTVFALITPNADAMRAKANHPTSLCRVKWGSNQYTFTLNGVLDALPEYVVETLTWSSWAPPDIVQIEHHSLLEEVTTDRHDVAEVIALYDVWMWEHGGA